MKFLRSLTLRRPRRDVTFIVPTPPRAVTLAAIRLAVAHAETRFYGAESLRSRCRAVVVMDILRRIRDDMPLPKVCSVEGELPAGDEAGVVLS